MGMSHLDAQLLIELRRNGHVRDPQRVVELGAQQAAERFLVGKDEIAPELAAAFGVDPEKWPLPRPAGKSSNFSTDAPPTRPFWEWLGFEYAAIDVDGSPGAIPLDLNYDAVPLEWRGHFCLVTNYGTTEHVCNQLNAFKIVHDLTALGGVMVHNLPAQGYINHGLFNYHMKFFRCLQISNGYDWLFESSSKGLARDNAYPDEGIMVAMKKRNGKEFVAPLDIPDASRAATPEIEARYWTVFRPEQRLKRTLRRIANRLLR
jgi:hypothetical protein